ncbi:MAG: hypothetical protein ACKOBG_06740 [Actinomycetota bacterium]
MGSDHGERKRRGVDGAHESGDGAGRKSGRGTNDDGSKPATRLNATLEARIVRAYEVWDGRTPRLDDFVAEFGISRPTLYSVLRRNGRPTKRDLLVQARERARGLDPDPPAGDGADGGPGRAADETARWRAEARRWEAEATRLRGLLVARGIDPDGGSPA